MQTEMSSPSFFLLPATCISPGTAIFLWMLQLKQWSAQFFNGFAGQTGFVVRSHNGYASLCILF